MICVLTLSRSREESSGGSTGRDLVRYRVFPIVCLSKNIARLPVNHLGATHLVTRRKTPIRSLSDHIS